MAEVVVVRQRPEAMDPEAELLHLGAVEPGVPLQPVGRREGQGCEDHHDKLEKINEVVLNF